jgi:uncharacterized protein YdaU (DUF1376 family)
MPNELAYMPTFISDFLTAVMGWPTDRVGAYWLALCYQWEQGGLPASDERELAQILHASRPTARRLWATIAFKFKPDAKGLWWNAKLEKVRVEARRQAAIASARGKSGAAVRWGKGAHVVPEHSLSNAQALPEQSTSNGNQNQNQVHPPNPPLSQGASRRRRRVTEDSPQAKHLRMSKHVAKLIKQGYSEETARKLAGFDS